MKSTGIVAVPTPFETTVCFYGIPFRSIMSYAIIRLVCLPVACRLFTAKNHRPHRVRIRPLVFATANLATMPGFLGAFGLAKTSDDSVDPSSQLFRANFIGVETGPMISQV